MQKALVSRAPHSTQITVYALVALLIFGCVLLMRMKRRKQAAAEFKYALDAVRKQLTEIRKLPPDYNIFPKAKRATGGLGETVIVINTLILIALISFVHVENGWPACLISLYVLISAAFLAGQLFYFHR